MARNESLLEPIPCYIAIQNFGLIQTSAFSTSISEMLGTAGGNHINVSNDDIIFLRFSISAAFSAPFPITAISNVCQSLQVPSPNI